MAKNFGPGILGSVVLIDPETGLPYKAEGVPVDATVAAAVTTPGSLTGAALSATYARTFAVDPAYGDGVVDATAHIQGKLDAALAAGGGSVTIPDGTYRTTGPLTIGKEVWLRGAGMGATELTVDHAGEGIKAEFPLNGASNPQRIRVSDMRIRRKGGVSTGVGVSMVGFAHLYLSGLHTFGFQHGIVLQQIQHGHIDTCILENARDTGIWLANAGDYRAGGGFAPPRTNHISIRRCMFIGLVTTTNLCDDGGWNHAISDISFEGGGTHLRLTGGTVSVTNIEFETCLSGPFVVLTDTTRAGTVISKPGIHLRSSILDSPLGYVPVDIRQAHTVIVEGFTVNLATGAAIVGVANADTFICLGSLNGAGGTLTDGGRAANVHYDLSRNYADLFATQTRKFGLGTTWPRGPQATGAELIDGLRGFGFWPDDAGAVPINLRGGSVKSAGAYGSAKVLFDMGDGVLDSNSVPMFGVGRGDRNLIASLDLRSGSAHRFFVNGTECLRVGDAWLRISSGNTASRPTAATAGVGGMRFDTTLNKPIWSDGANWRDAAGTIV